jgi:hypothetical protein
MWCASQKVRMVKTSVGPRYSRVSLGGPRGCCNFARGRRDFCDAGFPGLASIASLAANDGVDGAGGVAGAVASSRCAVSSASVAALESN